MKFKSLVLVVCIVCWVGIAHSATVNVYDTDSAYSAATGSQLFLIDFNGSTNTSVAGSSISTDATFGSPGASNPALVNWSSNALSDAGSVGPLSIEFTNTSTFAFSLEFSSAGYAETVELYDFNGTLLSTEIAPNAAGFFGLVSDTAFAKVIIQPGNSDRFFIDNLRTNAVPIPGAIWLLGSGLLGLIGVRRKKV